MHENHIPLFSKQGDHNAEQDWQKKREQRARELNIKCLCLGKKPQSHIKQSTEYIKLILQTLPARAKENT